MRIYSKFRDYYDVGLRYGVDPLCVYKRDSQIIDENEIFKYSDIFKKVGYIPRHWDIVEATHIILFCGRLYMCLEFFGKSLSYVSSKHTFIYTLDSLDKFIGDDDKLREKIFAHKRSKYSNIGIYGAVDEILNKFPTDIDQDLVGLLVETGVPIIRYSIIHKGWKRAEVELNPCLNRFEFFRILDPISAFQDIEVFISGIMGGQAPPMVKVSDEIRLEKHGFDKKTSFRKM